MNDVAGIIFSNLHDRSIPELTGNRTMGAIPFCGGYRMVDFPLSVMSNAGIKNISVIAHHNFESLVEHIGSGAEWGLPIDKGGVKIISPYMTAYAKVGEEQYTSRLETLKSIRNNLEKMKEKYIIMCDCDCIFNTDVEKMLEEHVKNGADVTVSTEIPLKTDPQGRISEIDQSPAAAFDMNITLWIVNRDYLVAAVKNAVSRGYTDITRDVIGKNISKDNFYKYSSLGETMRVKSLAEYYRVNMKLLGDKELREKVLNGIKSRKNTYLPTKIGADATVSSSVISEGCEINGTVENCIVFRGVKVEKGAVVKNSILFPCVVVAENAKLDFVIADKNICVSEGNFLAGCRMLPYFVGGRKFI